MRYCAPVTTHRGAHDFTRSVRFHIELTLLFLIMLCAALMARGIGFIG